MTLLVLNLLAFLFHTLLQLTNRKYQLLREELGTLSRYICFDNWNHLFDFMIESLELEPPPS